MKYACIAGSCPSRFKSLAKEAAAPAPPWTPKVGGPVQVTYCPKDEDPADWKRAGQCGRVVFLRPPAADLVFPDDCVGHFWLRDLIYPGSEDARREFGIEMSCGPVIYLGRDDDDDCWCYPGAREDLGIYPLCRVGPNGPRRWYARGDANAHELFRRARLRNLLPKEAKPVVHGRCGYFGIEGCLDQTGCTAVAECDAAKYHLAVNKNIDSIRKSNEPCDVNALVREQRGHVSDTVLKLLRRAEAVGRAHETGNVNAEQMAKLRQEAAALRAEVGEDVL